LKIFKNHSLQIFTVKTSYFEISWLRIRQWCHKINKSQFIILYAKTTQIRQPLLLHCWTKHTFDSFQLWKLSLTRIVFDQWRKQKISEGGPKHRRSQGGQSSHPPKFLENIVFLCYERRFSKQNSVIRLKLNILLYTAEYW